jgi:hypothetical protein
MCVLFYFYVWLVDEIASPALSDVKVTYTPTARDVSQTSFGTVYKGIFVVCNCFYRCCALISFRKGTEIVVVGVVPRGTSTIVATVTGKACGW